MAAESTSGQVRSHFRLAPSRETQAYMAAVSTSGQARSHFRQAPSRETQPTILAAVSTSSQARSHFRLAPSRETQLIKAAVSTSSQARSHFRLAPSRETQPVILAAVSTSGQARSHFRLAPSRETQLIKAAVSTSSQARSNSIALRFTPMLPHQHSCIFSGTGTAVEWPSMVAPSHSLDANCIPTQPIKAAVSTLHRRGGHLAQWPFSRAAYMETLCSRVGVTMSQLVLMLKATSALSQ